MIPAVRLLSNPYHAVASYPAHSSPRSSACWMTVSVAFCCLSGEQPSCVAAPLRNMAFQDLTPVSAGLPMSAVNRGGIMPMVSFVLCRLNPAH